MFNKEHFLIRQFVLILILLGLFGIGTQVCGAPKESATTKLEDFFILLEEEAPPVTTGVSRPLRKADVPASITVVTAEELKLLGLRHLTDVIDNMVPGAVGGIHRSTRTGLYAFRGITVDNNGKYVFMVDGLNCGDLSLWGAFNERYLGLMDELDRIEIIQGTGSILYGSGAISGIINFITKTGNTFQGKEVTVGYGSWDKVETSYKVGKKAANENEWTYFYYAGYKNSNGTRPKGEGGTVVDESGAGPGRRWDNFDHSGKFHANLSKGDFSLRMRYVRDRFEEPFVRGTGQRATSDFYWIEDYLFIQPEITRKLTDVSSIKANISFVANQTGMQKNHNFIAPAGTLIANKNDKIQSSGERKFRGQLFHYYDGWANHKLTSGLELFWMHSGPDFAGDNRNIKSKSSVKTRERLIKQRENLYFGALFFEDIWKWSDRTSLFIGARLEDHNKTAPNISPRVALSHNYSEKTNLKLLYNRGFRTPDWIYYDVNKYNGKGRPRPERVDSFEGHIAHQFTPKFTFTTVAYYTIYKDLINYWTGGGAYTNFPTITAAGLEFTGDYKTENLKLQLSHSYSKPVKVGKDNYDVVTLTYDTHDWSQFPTNMTKANAIITLVKDKCMLGVTYFRPWGIKSIKNTTHAKDRLQRTADYLNATITFKFSKNFELQLSGYNLTGETQQWWGANTTEGTARAVDQHREYFIRMIWKF